MQEIMQSIVFIAAAILHGITGMGFPMLGTTALAFIMPLSKVVALVALPSLLMSLLVLCSNNKKGFYQEIVYYLKTYKLLAIGSVVGSILGVKLLLILPVSWLFLLMAVITLYYSVNGILNVCAKAKNIQVVANNKNMVLFGFLAGVIGGSTNAMSPILLIFLLSVLSIIGLYVGIWLRAKISPNFFKMLIFIVLLVLALKIGHSGLIKL